jgi:hypothetical protein
MLELDQVNPAVQTMQAGAVVPAVAFAEQEEQL